MFNAMLPLLLALAPPSSLTCPTPNVAQPGGSGDFSRRFGGGTVAFREVANNLTTSLRWACGAGLLERDGVLGSYAGSAIPVSLRNAPNSNIASVTRQRSASGAWELVLEYHFVAADGSLNIPSEEEIEQAISCAVRGASDKEQRESGRCLPD